jgi:anti-anti-sigma factor
MTLQKETGEPGITEVSVLGYIRADDLPLSGANPLVTLLGDTWADQSMLLDLSKVSEIGSAGMGWLLLTHRAVKAKGGRLVIHSIKPMVAMQIGLMAMDRVIGIAPDRAAALKLLASTLADTSKGKQ